jgi:plasmid stabilization system protein ParE
MKVVVSRKADDDLMQAFFYLAERNPAAAENFMAAIDRKFGQLGRFPFIGHERHLGRDCEASLSERTLSFIW